MGALGSSELDAITVAAMDESIATQSAVVVDGYQMHEVTQAQMTAVKLFDQGLPRAHHH